METPSLSKANRCAAFAKRLARSAASFALVAAIAQLTPVGMDAHVAAAPPASQEDIRSELELIPPSWSQTLPAAERFKLVMGGAAVLDKETGLVWERSPGTDTFLWDAALFHCLADLQVGGRKGWRLPKIEELASLVDPTQQDPALPSGHPFTNIDADGTYWSATSNPGIPGEGVFVFFGTGSVGSRGRSLTPFPAWCVRGGQGVIDGIP